MLENQCKSLPQEKEKGGVGGGRRKLVGDDASSCSRNATETR